MQAMFLTSRLLTTNSVVCCHHTFSVMKTVNEAPASRTALHIRTITFSEFSDIRIDHYDHYEISWWHPDCVAIFDIAANCGHSVVYLVLVELQLIFIIFVEVDKIEGIICWTVFRIWRVKNWPITESQVVADKRSWEADFMFGLIIISLVSLLFGWTLQGIIFYHAFHSRDKITKVNMWRRSTCGQPPTTTETSSFQLPKQGPTIELHEAHTQMDMLITRLIVTASNFIPHSSSRFPVWVSTGEISCIQPHLPQVTVLNTER